MKFEQPVSQFSESRTTSSQFETPVHPHKTPLLGGHARHIVAANVRTLKNAGMGEGHATHLALKHAAKHRAKMSHKPAAVKVNLTKFGK